MAEPRHNTIFDTGLQHLGAVYAKALIGASEKAGSTDRVLEELESLVEEVINKLPALDATLSSPRVPLEVKEKMLDQAFRGQIASELLSFLKVLCGRGRFDCLRAATVAARRYYNELRGRLEVQVRSAEPLGGELLEATTARLTASLGCGVDLKVDIDPSLIGGLVIRVGDTVYDGSLVNRLVRLRDEMVTHAAHRMRTAPDQFVESTQGNT